MTTHDPRGGLGIEAGVQEKAAPAPAAKAPGAAFMRLGNWRVRSRLVALILLPTVVGVIFAAVQLTSAINTSAEYRRLTEVARLVVQLDELNHELAKERDYTALFIQDGRRNSRFDEVQKVSGDVDVLSGKAVATLQSLDSSHSARVLSRAAKIAGWLRGLPGLREGVLENDSVPARAAIVMYTTMISELTSLHEDLIRSAGSDERLFADTTALAAFTRAKEDISKSRGLLAITLASRPQQRNVRFDYDDLSDFLSAGRSQDTQLAIFQSEASPADSSFYRQTVKGEMTERAHSMRAAALAQLRQFNGAIQDLDRTRNDDLQRWFDSTTATIDLMREVEKRVGDSVVNQSVTLQDAEQRSAIVSGVLIVVLLLVVLVITTLVAGSLTRPLRRLRREALEIAGSRLPDTVQKLRESGEAADLPVVTPIGVTTSDEIGEVARAFDEVHREAIRLAGDEARLRSNVNSMFVNLSRRTQTLVERQLSLIDGLEQGEQDETRLGNLFKLDHLATRMRRNSENLLVLAGQEPARRWGQPVPIVDVVRASLSEVENYERVAIQVQSGAAVVGQSVNDVVHLIAELVENAISFSPRETRVTVSSNRIDGGGLMISVSDVGIGMTGDELAAANWRLANPPVVDVSVSRRMGLFVVGRLALRHGIRVQLRQQDVGGLTAMVLLPESLLAQPAGAFPGAPQQGLPANAQPGLPGSPTGSFGTPAPAAFGQQPALASPTPFETAPRPFGSDGPPDPWGSTTGGTPFDSSFGQLPQRNPFDNPPANTLPPAGPPAGPPATQRNPFDQPERDPFAPMPERGSFDTGPRMFGGGPSPTDTGPFDRNAFARGPLDSGAFEPPAYDQRGGFDTGGHTMGGFPSGGYPHPGANDTPWPGQTPGAGIPAWPGGPAENGSWPGTPAQRGPFEPDVDNTGPLPAVRNSPLDEIDEFLPIFAAVESDWFRRAPDQPEVPGDDESPGERTAWSSPAVDAGWQAAQAAAEPSLGGITSSGLPKRVPKANLVPGSADLAASSAPVPVAPAPSLSPDRVRNRLASFQAGVRQGRAVARGDISEEQGWPGANPAQGQGQETDKDEA
ncbi:nitrate- and nitrite sensing domain-containing protein [Herbidospora sp. NBRC 101105]|uniref:sensor histidine kinase n=1 Tax=Herbidospora sp. NBRC 101105 TaxID=3032195 RepID=UPI002556E52D|nr:nitrate- and nitrite sensing domain-containing protein [Herbidospora sp. NBRC 101105]